MKHISKYTFSIFIMLFSFFGNAQVSKKPENVKKTDTVKSKTDSIKPKTERYGLRVGVDLYKLSRSFYDKNYKGIELVGDFKVTRRHYLAVELGNENKTVDDTQLNFTTKGTYIKAGFDYNSYQNWVGMNNMIYVGMRYGISSFSQTLNSNKIYNVDHYFNESEIVYYPATKYNGLSAQWVEALVGIKAEIVKNLYMGFSARLNVLVSNKKPDNFDNLYIPGFNRTYNGNFGAGFNYTVSYFLPLYKSTVKAKEKMEKKK